MRMKKTFSLALALVVAAAGLALAQAKPDLTGTWVLDAEKSDPPPGPGGPGGPGRPGGPGGPAGQRGPGGPGGPGGMRADARSIDIAQTAKELKISREGPDGAPIVTVYALDGSESKNSTGRGTSKSKSRWDGAKLVTEGEQTFETPSGERTSEFKEVRSLGEGGKTLIVETTRQTPRGETTRKLVYNKK